MNLLFVYGTLMKGEVNHHYLRDCEYMGEAIIDDCELLELDGYPGIISSFNVQVRGEVYKVDDNSLKEIHELEGDEYLYTKGIVHLNDQDIEIYYYEYIKEENRQYVKSKTYNNRWISR